MADNYRQFSQVIEDLTVDEKRWLDINLTSVEDSFNDDHASAVQWANDMGIPKEDMDMWPDFEYKFEDNDTALWIYSDIFGNIEFVAALVSKFFEMFRPMDIFIMNYADTCSKPRVEEFGGGAIVVSAKDIKYIHSFDEAHKVSKRMAGDL